MSAAPPVKSSSGDLQNRERIRMSYVVTKEKERSLPAEKNNYLCFDESREPVAGRPRREASTSFRMIT
jgi:hypothetical protein